MEINELVFEEEKPQLQGDLQRRKTLPSFVKKLWLYVSFFLFFLLAGLPRP